MVAWLSSLPMGAGFDPQTGQMREPWAIYSEAQQLFDLRPLDPDADEHRPRRERAGAGASEGPLPRRPQFAIDQYALRGGHILAFVDPLAEADPSGADPQNPMAAMGADKSSHLSRAAQRLGRAVQSRRRWSPTAATRCR